MCVVPTSTSHCRGGACSSRNAGPRKQYVRYAGATVRIALRVRVREGQDPPLRGCENKNLLCDACCVWALACTSHCRGGACSSRNAGPRKQYVRYAGATVRLALPVRVREGQDPPLRGCGSKNLLCDVCCVWYPPAPAIVGEGLAPPETQVAGSSLLVAVCHCPPSPSRKGSGGSRPSPTGVWE